MSAPIARRLVRPLARAVAAVAAAVAASACATPIGWGSFSESGCPGETFSLVAAFVPTYDYAELRLTRGEGDAYTVETTAGTKCRGSKDTKVCEARLGDLRSSGGFSNGSHGRMPGHRYIVATRGDEIVVVDGTKKTVGQALAPIDSPAKAALVASVATGIAPACKSSVRRAGSAYEVYLSSDSCLGPVKELVRVEPDGRSRSVERATKPSTCVGEAPPPRDTQPAAGQRADGDNHQKRPTPSGACGTVTWVTAIDWSPPLVKGSFCVVPGARTTTSPLASGAPPTSNTWYAPSRSTVIATACAPERASAGV